MHHHPELSLVDEFRWVSPLHCLKNTWQNAVLLWCVLQAGPPSLYYYCAVVLHSCTVLPPVGHSSNHQSHCCKLKIQSSCVSNFYRTFKFFTSLSLVIVCRRSKVKCDIAFRFLYLCTVQRGPNRVGLALVSVEKTGSVCIPPDFGVWLDSTGLDSVGMHPSTL